MNDMKYIKSSNIDGIVTITLDRPKHNIMNIVMINEINDVLEDTLKNDSTKCLIFNANGPSWCAGVEVSEHKPKVVHNMINEFSKMFTNIHKLEIPIIATVHGACLGGGMELAIACDIIIASSRAFFGQPEIKIGFLPPYAAVRLPYLVGQSKAIEICTTGKKYTAPEFFQMGIISKITNENNKNTLDDDTQKIVKEIADSSPLIIRLNKRSIISHSNESLNEAFKKVNAFFLNTLMKTEDVMEGITSFDKKRQPSWKNK